MGSSLIRRSQGEMVVPASRAGNSRLASYQVTNNTPLEFRHDPANPNRKIRRITARKSAKPRELQHSLASVMQQEADNVLEARTRRAEIVNTSRRDEKQNRSLDRIGSRDQFQSQSAGGAFKMDQDSGVEEFCLDNFSEVWIISVAVVWRKIAVTTVPDEGENSFKMPRASVVHMTSTATRPQHMSQVLATLALSMGTLSSGLAKGYTSPALDSILDNQPPHLYQTSNNDTWSAFSVTQQEASWVASLSMLGAWFGAMIGDWIMRRGRRLALRVTSLPLAVVWILTGIAPCVELVYVTSFIGGLCCSVITMVAQVYISEISMPGIRGCLSAMLKVLGHVGVLLSYIAGTYLNWRQSALLVAIAPSMLFLGTLFIPETPSYLVLNGKDDEAANSLQWLRGDHVDIRHELQVIKTNILASRAKQYELTFKNSMFTPRLYKPIAITCGLMFFQRFSGANAFNYYAVIIFRQTLGGMNPHGATIAIGFVQLLASLLSGFLIDIVGRLPLLIASTVFMSLALAGFGSYAYYVSQTQNLGYPDSAVVGQHDWIPLLCVLVFTTALALGISPISWLLIGELFPLEYRGLGSSISTSFSYFCAFVGIKLFMDFQQTFGLHGAFWFYAAVAVCGLCFVVCCVPETKGKQLDEMNPDYAQAR
ncbi:Facilitated trehalose transporter Tret1-2 like protein [Melipona quadrifasciata]|uniref:Facilitated trehalose transporter Tret1-2 like protein n=2 Tax=Meliponini TaxID=83319 RepID=A0A0M9AAU7_9HYME|nr:Facilitated trehalose transporter Tret1-2 like protein [Melipona quadrifasciata]